MNKKIIIKYQCQKCGGKEFTFGQLRSPHSLLAQIMNIGFRSYTTVICNNCRFTELYACKTDEIENNLEKASLLKKTNLI